MYATSIANISTEIFGAILSFIIIIYLNVNDTKNTKLNRLFIRVLICNIVNLLSDAACWAVMGNTETYAFIINYAGTFLVYVFDYIILAAFTDYLFAYISSKAEVSKKYVYVIRVLTVLAVMLVIVSQFSHIYYYIDDVNIYHRTDFYIYVILSEILCMFTIGVMIVHYGKKLGKWDFIFLSSYIVLPVLAAVAQFMFYGIAPIYIATTLSTLIIFLGIQNEQTKLLKQHELELSESRISIMLSQIQPHFLYNSLTAISGLCGTDPERAEEALNDFSHYLRKNLDSLGSTYLITFENELEHLEHYLKLEKMRFGDRINVVYDLEVKKFVIPPLTVQPLAENAIRYGITKKPAGGTLTIATRETKDSIIITVSDDGLGFSDNAAPDNTRRHVGIDNVKTRIKAQLDGMLAIDSKVGIGTVCTITIPKLELPEIQDETEANI